MTTVSDTYELSLDPSTGPWMPARIPGHESIRELFEPGGPAAGQPFFDDDWFRFFPDGTVEVHELCGGCEDDATCPFHPPGCRCSGGICREHLTEAGPPTPARAARRDVATRLHSFASRTFREQVSLDAAALWLWQHEA